MKTTDWTRLLGAGDNDGLNFNANVGIGAHSVVVFSQSIRFINFDGPIPATNAGAGTNANR
jgi:hypothetical protein